jgi:death on curing protein
MAPSSRWGPLTRFTLPRTSHSVDGNKRTGLVAALVFLEVNGYQVADPKGALYDAMIGIAERRFTKSDLAHLLKTLAKRA